MLWNENRRAAWPSELGHTRAGMAQGADGGFRIAVSGDGGMADAHRALGADTHKGWFVYLRLDDLDVPYFEKTWIPGDVNKVN